MKKYLFFKLRFEGFSSLRTISFFLLLFFLSSIIRGQVSITNSSSSINIGFDGTITGVSNGAFTGSGFQSTPTNGQLDSDAWSVTGWSDGLLNYGGSITTGDYARGSTSAAVTTGGMYSYTGAPHSASNPSLMIQPGGSDWAPGTITLRIRNNGTSNITNFDVGYNLYVRNDQGRSSSFNFSYSTDGSSFTSVSSLDYTSPVAADALGWVKVGSSSPSRSTSISSLNIISGDYFYIRWSGADVGGSGSRDEFGLDDISISATYAVSCAAPTLSPTISAIQNIAGDVDFGGNITAVGGGTIITQRGFQFSTNNAMTSPTNLSESSSSTGAYSLNSVSVIRNTKYFYRAYASNDCSPSQTGYSSGTPVSNYIVTRQVATTANAATSISSRSLQANWTNPGAGGGESYTYKLIVEVETAPGSNVFANHGTYSGILSSTPFYNLSGLAPNTKYRYYFYSTNEAGDSFVPSNMVEVTTLSSATKLAFSIVPPSAGNVNTNMASFTVQAQRADNSVDTDYSGSVSLTRNIISGLGNLAGTTSVALSGGSAVFNAVRFNAQGTYTITATLSGLVSATSGNIVINPLSSATDYFQTSKSGNWNDVSASTTPWQSSTDGINWHLATLAPGTSATSVRILSGHHILLNSAGIVMTKTEVYGTVEVNNNDFSVNGVANGVELRVKDGGSFIVNGSGYDSGGNAYALVETGGKLISLSGSGGNFAQYYINSSNSGLFYFGNNSICEWQNTGTNLGSGYDSYFSAFSIGDMPIFRLVNSPGGTYGSATSNVFNAKLEVNSDITWAMQGNGSKTFLGGLQGTGVLTLTYATGTGRLVFGNTSNIPTMGSTGKLTLIFPNNKIDLPNGAVVPSTAELVLQSSVQNNLITRTGGNLTINGILDISNTRITNVATGGIIVNGTLRTSNTGGLYGTSAAIPSGTLTLNDNSTIDYYATANQAISSAPNYYNITFSGSGTKTPQNATSVNTTGTVRITGNPIVDFSSWNLGSTGANNSNLSMDGGRLIIGTGGTQPRLGGAYSITGGAIEFTGDSVTDIRVLPQYFNVIISGANKKPGAKGFTINNVLSLTSAGKLTIPEEQDNVNPFVVNAKKGIQVATGGEVVFKNNANLLQDVDATNSGSITMERNANVPSLQYNYWSSPIKNQELYSLYSGIPNNSVMVYNSSNDRFTILTTASNPLSTFAKGYSIKGSSTLGDAITAKFIGEPNNETTGGTNTIALSSAGSNYNLIGNPYPSNLNLQSLYNDPVNTSKFYNEADETPTAYFWDNTSNDNLSQVGSGYVNQNYAVFNLSSGVGTSAPRLGLAGKKPNGIVKPGQGFIIRASEAGGNLTFKNAFRIGTSGTGGVYYKMSQETNDKFWLRLTTSNDMNIVIAVAYNPEASNSFERFDSTIFSESVTENFYSLSSDSKKLAIQSRKGDFDSEDVIPLVVKTSVNGIQKIGIDDKAGVFAESQNIYLKDKLLNQIVNLSNGDYTFSAVKGTDTTRFEIVYKESSVLGNDEITKADFVVYRDKNTFVVKSSKKLGRVEVYDTGGRLVRQLSSKEDSLTIDVADLPNAVYIIKAENSGDIKTKKIIK